MFRIALFEQPLRQEGRRAGYLREGVGDRKEAVPLIEQHISNYQNKGYDGEQDRWWCRNGSDNANTILIIEPMPRVQEEERRE